MNNKTNIEEDAKIVEETIRNYNITGEFKNPNYEDLDTITIAIENVLADREKQKENIKIQEDNYQTLSESVFFIAEELDLEEDATIDEIITKIRILKSKRINIFEELDCIDKLKRYDSLIEKIEEKFNFYNNKVKDIRESNIKHHNATKYDYLAVGQRDAFQELLDIKKEN